jgi:hypothetical protein
MKRISNKFVRNKIYRSKHWKRVRAKEHPHETYCHWLFPNSTIWNVEKQIKDNFENIDEQARRIENGSHRSFEHAPSYYRRKLNRKRKAKERNALNKIKNGNYDVEIPVFRKDANWLYF